MKALPFSEWSPQHPRPENCSTEVTWDWQVVALVSGHWPARVDDSAGRYIDIDIVSRYFTNIEYRIEVFEYRDMDFDIFACFKA